MPDPTAPRTAGYIDAFCNRCAMNLGHTIIAMVGPKVVRVRCNTCGTDHAYRGQEPHGKSAAAGPRTAGPRAGAAPRPTGPSWADRLEGRDATTARAYTVRGHFRADELVAHKTFGLGVVTTVRDGKIDVVFRDGDKTLVNAPAPDAAG